MSKEKVLIVDDEREILELCKRILTTQGYVVTTANNGVEALKAVQQKSFDLLLTDIKMPGMTGLDIAQTLKETDPNLICVVMTGFATLDSAIKALSLGIDEFILKPFTPKDLMKGIDKALERVHLRRENIRLNSLIPLFELNKTLMGTVEVESVLNRLIEIAQHVTKANFAGLYILRDGKLRPHLYQNEDSGEIAAQQGSSTLAKSVLQKGEQVILRHSVNTPPEDEKILKQLAATVVVATPLKSLQSTLGVLILAHTDSAFAPSDNEFLSVLCGQAGIALENARAYQQLQLLDHLKSEFINIAAHELRTPLSILLGYASILEEEATENQQFFVSNIIRNAMRLRSLMDDMLNLKKLESGMVAISQNQITLREVAEEIIQDLDFLSDKTHRIKTNIPDDFPQMIVDRQKFELILVNLVHNAIKFTPNNGAITFSASAHNGRAIISLHNTQTFIPEEERERIFERFYQIEDSLTREHGGAGLGLAIARGMAEVCDGQVSVESSESAGTTFIVELPLDNSHLTSGKLRL
jgi:signal transduction histidine kinase